MAQTSTNPPAVPEDGLYYTFSRPAGAINKVLRALKQKEQELSRYYSSRTPWHILFYLGAIVFWFIVPNVVFPLGFFSDIMIPMALFGVIAFVIAALIVDFIDSPLTLLKRACVTLLKWGAFFFGLLIVFSFVEPGVSLSGLLHEAWGFLVHLPGVFLLMLAPVSRLSLPSFIFLLPCLLIPPGVVAMMYYRHRLKRCRIQEYELAYIVRVLQPLLKEMPAEVKCQVSFNPFHSSWSIDSVAGWDQDNLLRFLCRPEPNSRLALSVTHLRQPRISSRGKHKGYRHRISYRLSYAHPLLATVGEAELVKLQSVMQGWVDKVRLHGSQKAGASASASGDYASRWLPLSGATKLAVRVSAEKVSISLGTKAKIWRKELEPEDLIRPSALLEILRGMTEVIGSCNLESTAERT